MRIALYLILALAAPVSIALAQQAAPEKMPGMDMSSTAGDASPSSKAFKAADDKMMHDMMGPKSGDADKDFVSGMLPHHQGAVDMAKVELQYGKDPEIRRLAAGIVKAQEKEIALMKAWQAKHHAAH
jgi:uncharacterized protein (DUF305 family)